VPFTWNGPCGPIQFRDLAHANSFILQILALPPTADFDCVGSPEIGQIPIQVLQREVLLLQAHLFLPHEGPRGPTGATGATGAAGSIGPQGLQGFSGTSPTADTILGLLNPLVDALPLLQGDRGIQGFQGIPGETPTQSQLQSLIQAAIAALGSLIGATGPAGVQGIPGIPGTSIDPNLSVLAAQVARQIGQRTTDVANVERVSPGGTVNNPLIVGSAADPAGPIRPVFGIGPGGGAVSIPTRTPPPSGPPTTIQTIAQFLRWIFGRSDQRGINREIFRANRRAAAVALERARAARQQAGVLHALLNRRTPMGFGQSLGEVFQSLTQGIGSLAPAIQAAAPFFAPTPNLPAGGGPLQTPSFAPSGGGFSTAGLPALIGGALTGGAAFGLGEGAAMSLFDSGAGGGSNGSLFKMTPSGKVRAVSKATVMGPDGKCHFFLHATPKGWKVNASNVSGRRPAHHHHRRPR